MGTKILIIRVFRKTIQGLPLPAFLQATEQFILPEKSPRGGGKAGRQDFVAHRKEMSCQTVSPFFADKGFFVAKNRYICLYMIPSRHIVFLYYSSIGWGKQLKFSSFIYNRRTVRTDDAP